MTISHSSLISFEQTLYDFEDHITEITTPLRFIKKDDRKPRLFWLNVTKKNVQDSIFLVILNINKIGHKTTQKTLTQRYVNR